MCGRFTLKADAKKLAESFVNFTPPKEFSPRYNIAPSQPVAVVTNSGQKAIDFFQWGLIPSWAKDPKIGNRMINARAETLAEKPSFRVAYRRRRCLVLSDGFYEWRATQSRVSAQGGKGKVTKTPMYIQLESREPFAFAGLWEYWQSPYGEEVLSCTIITTRPNEFMEKIHNRMPVILPPKAYEQWLEPTEQKPAQVQPLLKPYPAEEMIAHPVSTLVNNPRNDVPQCVAPLAQLL